VPQKEPQSLSEGAYQDLQVKHSILCNTRKEPKSSSGKVLIPATVGTGHDINPAGNYLDVLIIALSGTVT
jgi:hypothetical protein